MVFGSFDESTIALLGRYIAEHASRLFRRVISSRMFMNVLFYIRVHGDRGSKADALSCQIPTKGGAPDVVLSVFRALLELYRVFDSSGINIPVSRSIYDVHVRDARVSVQSSGAHVLVLDAGIRHK